MVPLTYRVIADHSKIVCLVLKFNSSRSYNLNMLLILLFFIAYIEQGLSAGDDSTESLRLAAVFWQVHSTLSVLPRLALIAMPPLLLICTCLEPQLCSVYETVCLSHVPQVPNG